MALAIGLVAGRPVTDQNGNILVDAGQRVTREMAERVRAAGRLPSLVASVLLGLVQDVAERLQILRSETPQGKEETALGTVEAYAEARQWVGRVAMIDVTDVRGNIVIPSGTRLTEAHIRLAREHRLLDALKQSASLPQPEELVPAIRNGTAVTRSQPSDTNLQAPSSRARLPLIDLPVRSAEDNADPAAEEPSR